MKSVTVEVPDGATLVLVRDPWADVYRVWSEPIQVMVEPLRFGRDDDVVELRSKPAEIEENDPWG